MAFGSENGKNSPKRLTSPFKNRNNSEKPTLATMPDSLMTSFAAGEELNTNLFDNCFGVEEDEIFLDIEESEPEVFEERGGKRLRTLHKLSQSFTDITRLSKRTKHRLGKIKTCFGFRKDVPDLAGLTIRKEKEKDVLSELTTVDKSILRYVCSYLAVNEVIALSLSCRVVCESLSKVSLRLDSLSRSFSFPVLTRYFSENNSSHDSSTRLTDWKVSGVCLSSELPSKQFWNYLNVGNLVCVKFRGNWTSIDFNYVSLATKLETMEFGLDIEKIENIENLKYCTKLKSIALQGCETVVSTELFLPKTNTLASVQLRRCYNLVDITSLAMYNSITSLDLSECTNLFDFSSIGSCVTLETLVLKNCRQLRDLDFLKNLDKLKKLCLSGCVELTERTCFSNLKTGDDLEDFTVDGCPPMPLIEALNPEFAFTSATVVFSCYHALKESLNFFSEGFPFLEAYIYRTKHTFKDVDYVFRVNCVLHVLAKVYYRDTNYNEECMRGVCLIVSNILKSVSSYSEDTDEDYEEIGNILELASAVLGLLNNVLRNYTAVVSLINNIFNFDMVEALLNFCKWKPLLELYFDDDDKLEHVENNAASCLLQMALIEETRETFYSQNVLETLLYILYKGSDDSAIEAAGTIWNLAASLKVGRVMGSSNSHDCISALLFTLRNRSNKAKAQAIGALRNLAIVKENANNLMNKLVVPHLVNIINSLIDPEWCCANFRFNTEPPSCFFTEVQVNSEKASQRFELDINHYLQQLITKVRQLDEDQRTVLSKSVATLRLLTSSADFVFSKAEHDPETVLFLFSRLFTATLLTHDNETAPFVNFDDKGEDIITDCASSLLSMSFDSNLRNGLGSSVLIKALVKMISSSKNSDILLPCCGIFWNMALKDEFEMRIVKSGGIQALLPCLQQDDILVANKAAGALKNLFFNKIHKQLALQIKAEVLILNRVKQLKLAMREESASAGHLKCMVLLVGSLKMLVGTCLYSRIEFIKLGIVGVLSDFLSFTQSTDTPYYAEQMELIRFSVDILDYLSALFSVSIQKISEEERAVISEFTFQLKHFEVSKKLLVLTYSTCGSAAKPAKWAQLAQSIINRIPQEYSIETTY